jgi:3-isopropylmalate/(R)-2-methylmalate dehydratase small subunit
MEPFKKHTGTALPLDRSNIDTDQIIPKQFMKMIERTGFGSHLFHNWRYIDEDEKLENPEFILNRTEYRNATVLIARENFGCGSSRENAPWALRDFGFRAVIAQSFADIFFGNCIKNGLLPVKFTAAQIEIIFQYLAKEPGAKVMIDLEENTVSLKNGVVFTFELDRFHRESLLNGWDDIGLTLRYKDEIDGFEKDYFSKYPVYRTEQPDFN